MSKLALANLLRREYDQAALQDALRQIEQQGNRLAEGSITARHGAMTAAPTTGSWVRGDVVDNLTPSAVSDAQADYVIMGWICTASGSPGTWKERRVLVEGITVNAPTLGTEVASTSGTSIDFTGIPSWVTQITISFVGVSTNGTSAPLVQIGDSGGIETASYSGSGSNVSGGGTSVTNFTAGFGLMDSSAAGVVLHGTAMLTLENSATFTWTFSSTLGRSDAASFHIGGGSKSLSAALDRVRITTANGTDAFDAGAINIRMS